MEEYTHEQIKYEQDTGMVLRITENLYSFTAKHWHNGFEIIYITDGGMTVTDPMGEYHLRKGGFAVINCKTIHSACNKGHCRYLLLQIPYEKILQCIPDIDRITIRCICKEEQFAKNGLTEVRNTLKKLVNLYESPHDCGYLPMLNCLIYEILYHLVTKFRTGTDPELKRKTERNIQRLGIVLQYVRRNYAENISLSDAASVVALNKEYFARFFKKYMGMTFMDYVFTVRLEYAYYDIINTDLTISEIAGRCGFEKNYKLFVRKFREQYGCNPAEKRRQNQ